MEGVRNEISLPVGEVTIPAAHWIRRLPGLAGTLGVLLLIGAFLLDQPEHDQFYHSYLVAYLFFLSLALGALIFVLIQFACRAGWSVAVRRIAENTAGTLPLMALLFLPLVPGFEQIFSWLEEVEGPHDALLVHKRPYLNAPFLYLRCFLYLVAWSSMGWWFRRLSIRQDQQQDTGPTRALQAASPLAIVVFAITITFAAFDWIMSLDPHWYSTILGVYFFSGSFVGVLAFLILLILVLQRQGLLQHTVSPEHFHDLGKLLFGFVVFWAYIAFSQFMLIWYANLPEETVWYMHRMEHGWEVATWILAVGHFVLPFFVLLPRGTKRNPVVLLSAALWLLAMHYLDLYWLVMPALSPDFHPRPMDALTLLGVGLVFLGGLSFLLTRAALLPVRDPRLAESISFENI